MYTIPTASIPLSHTHTLTHTHTHVHTHVHTHTRATTTATTHQVVVDFAAKDASVPLDLLAVENGGVAVGCSNQHFGHPRNLGKMGLAPDMGDGWETARHPSRPVSCSAYVPWSTHVRPHTLEAPRRIGSPTSDSKSLADARLARRMRRTACDAPRTARHVQAILEMGADGNLKLDAHQRDWSILKLGHKGTAVSMEVDTNHFKVREGGRRVRVCVCVLLLLLLLCVCEG